MEPRIQYAKTSDGVNIAYYSIGHGPPLVRMPNMPASHLQLEWQIAELRRSYEQIANQWTLVRYDPRGFGLSDRDVTDFSVEALTRDLDAVRECLELAPMRLVAMTNATVVAMTYAARNPKWMSHLVLWHGYARPVAPWSETLPGLLALAETDWGLAIDAYLHTAFGWTEGDLPDRLSSLIREAVSRETFIAFFRQFLEWDVSDLLPLIGTPTLVVQRRQYRMLKVETAQKLAARIPDAQLVLLEGSSGLMDRDFFEMVSQFLGIAREREATAVATLPSGTAIILFADIADSTALTERLGDAAFRAKARELDATLRAVIREHAGTAIEGKLLGDGVLAVFTSARQAIEAALACASAGASAGMPLHLGLHAGDVIREENNVYGGAVNIASRISGLSAPGEVLVSETVRSLARTSAGVRFEDRGEQSLKGVGEAVRVWTVREAERSPSTGSGQTEG